MTLEFAAITYRAIRDRIRAEDPQKDEQTLANTVEGLTDLHEILTAIIRAALADQALATGLEGRIAEMQARLNRLQDRAVERRQIAKDVIVELDLKKLSAPDFTASVRPGTPALLVLDEAAVPSIYWEPRVRDKAHLKYIASQACLICGRQPSDPHHLRFAQPRAIGVKVSDEFTVPLCRGHHRQLHQIGNEVAWWDNQKINALEIAKALWDDSRLRTVPATQAYQQQAPTNSPHEDASKLTIEPN